MAHVKSASDITKLNQSADRMIRDIEAGRSTIGAVCAEWNRLCFEAGATALSIHTPRRRDALVGLLRSKQFYVNWGDERTVEGNDPREWSGVSIESAHYEALDMNEWFGFNEEQRAAHNERVMYGLNLMAIMNQPTVLDACHAEALKIKRRMDAAKKTVLGKVVSGATKRAESYGRFYVGRPVSHISIDCSKSYGGTLSTNDMKIGCYSVAAFNR
ncbi:hypothetical protein [Serratia fonticola]